MVEHQVVEEGAHHLGEGQVDQEGAYLVEVVVEMVLSGPEAEVGVAACQPSFTGL